MKTTPHTGVRVLGFPGALCKRAHASVLQVSATPRDHRERRPTTNMGKARGKGGEEDPTFYAVVAGGTCGCVICIIIIIAIAGGFSSDDEASFVHMHVPRAVPAWEGCQI